MKTNIEIIGDMGEKIVTNYLSSLGKTIKESIDPFDREKDLLADGQKVEVKTEQPFVKQNAFSFRENQLRKCRSVDLLYFVSIPPLFNLKYKWGGWVFEADPKTFQAYDYVTKSGRKMILIPIIQKALKPVLELTEEEKNEFLKYCQSDYTRK